MAEMITDDEIDFSFYEKETDAQQKVKPASAWIQELMDRIESPVIEKRSVMPWRKTHSLIQFRPGEVTCWAGANGSGKSLITGQVGLSLGAQNERVCFASFEMKPIKTLERMARQWSTFNAQDQSFRGNTDAKKQFLDLYGQFKDWTDNRLWMYDQQGTITAAQVCAVARYFAKEKKGTHFFIDSLMKCVAGEDDYNGQKAFVDTITSIARDTGMHIHLVHHIRKPASEDAKPSKYDYKGSGAITDQVDNTIGVWRNKQRERDKQAGKRNDQSDALLICDKQRNGDWEGAIALWFDPASQQFLAADGDEPISLYLHPEE